MIRLINTLFIAAMMVFVAVSCSDMEDPGPLQHSEVDYELIDFDRLEMGSAFHIEVEQSSTFSIHIEGDRRNLNDMDVYKRGSTLVIEYDENEGRKHDTYVTIRMPVLKSAHFTGASSSIVKGFESEGEFDLYLTGASVAQVDAGYGKLNVVLSGASNLRLYGLGDAIDADLSGASVLSAFDYPVRTVTMSASGASIGKITVTDDLDAVATGASAVTYRGNPSVSADVSGGSTVVKD